VNMIVVGGLLILSFVIMIVGSVKYLYDLRCSPRSSCSSCIGRSWHSDRFLWCWVVIWGCFAKLAGDSIK